MRFRILGPLEIETDRGAVSPQSLNQRAALGYLLIHANRVVSTTLLIQTRWGENTPPTAKKMLQNAIAGVRSLVAQIPGAELVTRSPGYLICTDPDDIDVTRFHTLVRRGRTELSCRSVESGIRTLRQALALWRGPALEDLTEEGLAWPELTTLQEARTAAFEDCMAAELSLGRHFQVIDELEAALAVNPLRERLTGQTMLALYRCGRQVDALALYANARSFHLTRIDTDLSPSLHHLATAIREHDPSLIANGSNRVCFIQSAFAYQVSGPLPQSCTRWNDVRPTY